MSVTISDVDFHTVESKVVVRVLTSFQVEAPTGSFPHGKHMGRKNSFAGTLIM